MAKFHHPTIAFGQIVGERHVGVGQEAEYVRFAGTQAQQKVMTDPARLAFAAVGPFPRPHEGGLGVVPG